MYWWLVICVFSQSCVGKKAAGRVRISSLLWSRVWSHGESYHLNYGFNLFFLNQEFFKNISVVQQMSLIWSLGVFCFFFDASYGELKLHYATQLRWWRTEYSFISDHLIYVPVSIRLQLTVKLVKCFRVSFNLILFSLKYFFPLLLLSNTEGYILLVSRR